MPEDLNEQAVEPERLATSTRAAAMWLAFLAVALGGVLLLALWSTGLTAHLSPLWRWAPVEVGAVGLVFLAWAVVAAVGVFTQASASPADPGFLSVRSPIRFFDLRRSRSEPSDLQALLRRTARVLGADEVGEDAFPPTTKPDQPRTPAEELDEELDLERWPGHLILPAAGSSKPDVRRIAPPEGEKRPQRTRLVLPLAAASGLLAPRNHWIARVRLRAAGERVAVGGLFTIVAVLLLASGRVALPAPHPSQPSPTTTTVALPPTVPRQPMLTNVAAGVAPVLAAALAQPLAELATSAAATPGELRRELEKLVLDNAVAPFLYAGSTTLGEALFGALARWARLTPSAPPATPPKETVDQVRAALQEKLKDELAASPELRAIAAKAGRTPDQLATELASTIAQRLASDLARGLVRLPSSRDLDDRFVVTIAVGVTQQLRQRPPPTTSALPPGRSYTVQPGDSLWRISQRLLGPRATNHEIDQAWRVIYRDNHTTIGADPNRIIPGQVLRIPRTLEATPSRGWMLPWLVAAPGALAGLATRRRWRSGSG
jgi:LysM repeat protein